MVEEEEEEESKPTQFSILWSLYFTSSNMNMVMANASCLKYQTTLQTSDLRLLLLQLQIVGIHQTQKINTIFVTFYSILLNNLFGAVNTNKGGTYILPTLINKKISC